MKLAICYHKTINIFLCFKFNSYALCLQIIHYFVIFHFFYFTEPDIPPPGGERDVAFLIDGSDDVRGDFSYIRDFISKVIAPLDIGPDRVRVAVVQHSERPTPNFYLNTYQTKDEVLRAVNGLTLAGGRSLNTGAALTFMKNNILTPAYGSRAAQKVPQFLIVLTGGRSRDSVRESAVALKTEGVVPFGVGVKNADPKQIEAISHNPTFAFNVKEFSQLNTVPQRIQNYVSLPKAELEVVLEAGKKNLLLILLWLMCLHRQKCTCMLSLCFCFVFCGCASFCFYIFLIFVLCTVS